MQCNMNVSGLERQVSQDSYILDNTLRKKKVRLWNRPSLKGNIDRPHQNTATLPRSWKQTKPICTNSLVDYTDPQRTTIILEKQDNETFGFEIQTYGLQLKDSSAVEMCTFVCKVQTDSVAENAGVTTGDVIITINGVSIEGLSHQRIVNLIRESTNLLKMETVCGTIVKRIELEKKMSLLKQTLREKWVELQALTAQEKGLLRDNWNGNTLNPSIESTDHGHGQRFSSDSSYRSVMTEDSDQASVFDDVSSPSTTDDGCFFPSHDRTDYPHQEISRSLSTGHNNPHHISRGRSSSVAGSSTSLSPTWEETRASTLFGTLPRKARRSSVRKHILRLIPAFSRSVEEEGLGQTTTHEEVEHS